MQMVEGTKSVQGVDVDTLSTLSKLVKEARWAELKQFVQKAPELCFQAFKKTGIAERLSEQQTQALLIFANLLISQGAHATAGWALYYAARQLGGVGGLPLPMQNALLRHHPLWTQDVLGERVVLARPRAEHHADLLKLFKKRNFVSRFNAFLPPPEVAAKEFIERTTPKFDNNTQIHWLIQTPQNMTTGLVTLSGFDYINRRAEIQFGFTDAAADGRARMEAFQLVLYLVFNELKMSKLCSLVYSTNHAAQDMTLKMGLVQEGRLRKHLLLPGVAKPVDLFVNSLLVDEFNTSPIIQKHSKLVFKTYDPTKLFELAAPVQSIQ